ncbi:gp16 family protein [Leptolyngbyaceae cyanobacterium UHCC 1019]
MKTLPKEERVRLLALIHIAKKQLGFGDESYRDLIERETKHRSAADCDDGELLLVLEEFKRLGFRLESKGGKLSPQTRNQPDKDQAMKIRALWIEAYQCGAVQNRWEQGLQAFVMAQTKVKRVEWLKPKQASQVIEALKAMIARKDPHPSPLPNGEGTGGVELGGRLLPG